MIWRILHRLGIHRWRGPRVIVRPPGYIETESGKTLYRSLRYKYLPPSVDFRKCAICGRTERYTDLGWLRMD